MSATSLFERAMGDDYSQLDGAVQRFHRLSGRHRLQGEVRTQAPASWPAWLIAVCLGLPRRASRGTIRFELDATPGLETWTRHFPLQTLRSELRPALRPDTAGVTESLGPLRLSFALTVQGGALDMRLERVTIWRVACPRGLMPRIRARESGVGDRLHFVVEAALPLVGHVARYDGHLAIPGTAPP